MSLTHTSARKQANDAGVRTASMPGVTEQMMIEGGLTANPREVVEHTRRLAETFKGASEIRLVSDLGTDISFEVDASKWNLDVGCCQQQGCSTNLPAGEVFTAPENCKGTVVIDGSMGGLKLLKHPIKIRVEEGRAVDVQGDRAKEVLKIINPLGDEARNIAELGIGTNPRARIIGVVLEDEKVRGTAHIALGDNSTIGGHVVAGVHLDAIIRKPRVFADGHEIDLV
jgi:leucyl aminopeptidase (aminopeptidase T)